MVSWSNLEKLCSCSRTWMVSALACGNKWIQGGTYTCHTESENLDVQLLRNDTSFLSNLLCKSPLNYYSPTIFVRLFQPIH